MPTAISAALLGARTCCRKYGRASSVTGALVICALAEEALAVATAPTAIAIPIFPFMMVPPATRAPETRAALEPERALDVPPGAEQRVPGGRARGLAAPTSSLACNAGYRERVRPASPHETVGLRGG